MKKCYLYSTPSGPINLIKAEDMPVKPELGICSEEPRQDCYNQEGCICAKQWMPYHAALQRAKESSVPIQDQEKAAHMIHQRYELKRGEVYGPFTVGYKKQGVCCSPIPPNINHHGYCDECDRYAEVAILYDDTPEKEHSGLREALREVKAKNRELRDSYNDPTRLDFRIKDSRGFPTGEVVDEAKVVPEKEPQEDQEALLDELAKIVEYVEGDKVAHRFRGMMIPVIEYNELIKMFTITRKQ